MSGDSERASSGVAPRTIVRRDSASDTAIEGTDLDRRSRQGTDEALALYRAIFVKSTDAIAIIDPEGRYLEQNRAHERLLGWTFAELRGQTPAIHMGDEAFALVGGALASAGAYEGEIRSRTKDGRVLDIELSAFAVQNAAGAPVCFVGIKRDITERKRVAAERERRFQQLRTLYRMADALSRAGALDEIYDEALSSLRSAFRTERASILLFDDDDVMRFKAWRGLSTDYRAAVEGHSPWRRDAAEPQPIVVEDVHADGALAGYRALFERERIRALCFIPLLYDGRLLGKFMLYFADPRRLDVDEVQLAQAIGSHIAFAIERTRNEAEVARLFRDAQQANLAKSQFLATMSHELRTPLNAIAGYTELLELGLHGPLTEAQRDDLARIRVNQQHLLGLINDVLSFAKIETGHLELDISSVPVAESLATLRALIEPQLQIKGLEYRYEPPEPSLLARADREKVHQIVLNLLSNAIKFTPSGGAVTLACTSAADVVRIEVGDTGPGIPADKLELIFEPFVQLHHGFTRRSEGSGLGLAISRELARAMGGDVTVSSIFGEGTTFLLTLPRA